MYFKHIGVNGRTREIDDFFSTNVSTKVKGSMAEDENNTLRIAGCSRMYGTWCTGAAIETDEKKLTTFGRQILRRIFGQIRNVQRKYEIRSDREMERLYGETFTV